MLHWFDADVMPRLTMCPSTEEVVRLHQLEHAHRHTAGPNAANQ